MNFFSRIFSSPAPEAEQRDAIDAIFERVREARPFAVLPFETTLGAHSSSSTNSNLAHQCDGEREIFLTPAERPIAHLRAHGLTAIQMAQFEFARRIAQHAAISKASVFLLSPSGISDVRLAHHLGCDLEPPLAISGSMVIEQFGGLTNADADAIIARVARSGAALCFAAIDSVMGRRLAARARKQRVSCGFIILPAGWRKLGSAAHVGYSGNPAASPTDSLDRPNHDVRTAPPG